MAREGAVIRADYLGGVNPRLALTVTWTDPDVRGAYFLTDCLSAVEAVGLGLGDPIPDLTSSIIASSAPKHLRSGPANTGRVQVGPIVDHTFTLPRDSVSGVKAVWSINDADLLDGRTFEVLCQQLLHANGFDTAELTSFTNDQGADIVATMGGVRYAVQCKCYSHPLGNRPVQEALAGRAFYKCDRGAVMTNTTFTKGGVAAAEAADVERWGRPVVERMIRVARPVTVRVM